jgi:glutathione synthase/RimK-type ligase-like ATP-grasp enzyme
MSSSLSASRVALITYSGVPAITTDDRLLRDALVARGAEVDARPWDARTDWSSYHRLVLRSCWNFHHRPKEFLLWVNEVKERHDGSLRNSPALVQWSVDKRYLMDLEAGGVAIVPTIWVSAADGEPAPNLDELIATQGWKEGAVVKPAISATAHQTWLVEPSGASAHQPRFESLLATSPSGVMVQPFLPEIRDGEWSLVFLGGEFSHAVVKRPADGDFRVQNDFGGSVERREPSAELIEDGLAVLSAAARATNTRVEDILYARVDGIVRDESLLLMELEVIEPALFFSHAPGAAARMAELIVTG